MEREEVRQRFQKIKERAFRKVDEEWQRALVMRPTAKEPPPTPQVTKNPARRQQVKPPSRPGRR